MAPKLPRSSEVWHGKTYVVPSPEGADAPPVAFAIWVVSPDRTVVHVSMEPVAKGPVRLVTSFDEATRAPASGSPRMPRRIVVEDRQSADQLKRLHGVEVQVKGVPMIDEVVNTLAEVAIGELKSTPSGRVSSVALLELQRAAALLWKTAPWERLFDSEWLVIDAPGDPLDGHVVSVVGARREVFGFCKHPSVQAARRFVDDVDDTREGPPPNSHYLLLTINSPSELSPSERRQPAPAALGKRRAVVMKQEGSPAILPPTEAEILAMARVARALVTVDLDTLEGEAEGLRLRSVFDLDESDLHEEDESAPSGPAPASRWSALDKVLFPALFAFARGRDLELGPGKPATCLDYDQIFWELGRDGSTAAEAWRQTRDLGPEESMWYLSHGDARTSVHRVLAVSPGRHLELEDIFTGQRRVVVERSAAVPQAIGFLFLARVVETEGECWLSALDPMPLPEALAPELRRLVGAEFKLPKLKLIDEDRLRPLGLSLFLAPLWSMAREIVENAPPPTLRNTDGHLMVDVSQGFVALERERLVAWLDAQPTFRRDSPEKLHWIWWKDGFQGRPEMTTTLGHLSLDGRRLTATTNSVERADVLTGLLEGTGFVRQDGRKTTPISPPKTPPSPRPVEVPPAEALSALQDFKTRYYATWPDTPVPALGGKTPRKAITTPAGRAQVEALLRDMERMESQDHAPARFDVNILRRELGLAPSPI